MTRLRIQLKIAVNLDKNTRSQANRVLNISQHVYSTVSYNSEVLLFETLQPMLSLSLRIDQQRPSETVIYNEV